MNNFKIDNQLPYDQSTNGSIYANYSHEGWVALLEKAYAYANSVTILKGPGNNINDNSGTNSYTTIYGGFGVGALSDLTGTIGKYSPISNTNFQSLLNAKEPTLLETKSNIDTKATDIIDDHVYAVIGYDSNTNKYELYNRWGLIPQSDNKHNDVVNGLLELSVAQIQQYFAGIDYIDYSTSNSSWNNTNGGSWFTAGNWSSSQLPSSQNSVYITTDGTYTVLVNDKALIRSFNLGIYQGISSTNGTQTLTISTQNGDLVLNDTNDVSYVGDNGVLNLNAGIITGSQQLVVDGVFNWKGGTLSNSLTQITESGTANTSGDETLDGTTLETDGNTTWFYGGNNAAITGKNSATWNNSGTVNLASDVSFNSDNSCTINNSGTFVKTGTNNNPDTYHNSFIDPIFNNSGTVKRKAGNLNFFNGLMVIDLMLGIVLTLLLMVLIQDNLIKFMQQGCVVERLLKVHIIAMD